MNVACPASGEEEALQGHRDGETIAVTCLACCAEWVRDPRHPTCTRCGGDSIVSAPKALVEKSRGTQLSVVGTTTMHFCRDCAQAELDAYLATSGSRLVMPEQLPTTSGDREAEPPPHE